MPEQVGCRDYKAFAGLPDPFQSGNVGYVFRPEAQPFARELSGVRAGIYVIVVKDKLVANPQGIFAEADETSMLLPRT